MMTRFLWSQTVAAAVAAAVVVGGVLGWAAEAAGQHAFTAGAAGGTYQQDFDTLPAVGVHTWENDVTLPNWHASKTGANALTIEGNTGSNNTGRLYAYRSAVNNPDDLALGSVASAGIGTVAYGVFFTNSTGAPITQLDIDFVLEQWRDANTTPQNIKLYYRIGGATFDLAGNAGSWTLATTDPASLDSPTNGSSGAIDGNDAANRYPVKAVIDLTATPIANGQNFWLGWRDTDDAGSDHGLAIDDLFVIINGGVGDPPTIDVSLAGQPVANGARINIFRTGELGTNLPLEIVIADTDFPGDFVTVTATVSNSSTITDFDIDEWQANNQNATIQLAPSSGIFSTVGEHQVAISAIDSNNKQASFNFTIQVDERLSPGDVMIVGVNSQIPNGFSFVTFVPLAPNAVLVFTDESFDGSLATPAFRANENTYRWQAPNQITPAGTVVVVSAGAGPNFASYGTLTDPVIGLTASGDQLFVYQGDRYFAPNLIFGLNFANAGWITGGSATDGNSYRPAALAVTNGSLDLTALSGDPSAQFTGERDSQTSFADYRTDIVNLANWTTAATTITLNSTPFTLANGTQPFITSTALTSVVAGNNYSYTITVAGNPTPTVGVSGLPAWLAFDSSTNTLHGSPQSGNVGTTGSITVIATNGILPIAMQQFTITVAAAPPPPSVGGKKGCGLLPTTTTTTVPTASLSPLAPVVLVIVALAMLRRRRRLNPSWFPRVK